MVANGLPKNGDLIYLNGRCESLVAPLGLLEIRSEFVVEDSGLPDEVCPSAQQSDVAALPADVLPFLLASRYCDTEKLSDLAWSLFGGIQGGWQRAQATCDYALDRSEFGYHHARGDRTASEGHEERHGRLPGFRPSCRDALTMHEHPGPLLHGLPRRHRRFTRSSPDGFQRVVRGVPGWSLVHFRRETQPSSHWTYRDCEGT